MMAVNLGDKPLADFTQPIEMMQDCHRRIEHFLDVLKKVLVQFGERDLTDDGRRALEASLNYFAMSAPRHTADEEQSLFPRIRTSESDDARALAAELRRLECDHLRGEAGHALVERLGREWLATGRIDKAQRKSFHATVDILATMYAEHIRLEERHVFVVASRVLAAEQLREIGAEMKQRRSLTGLKTK